MGLLPFDQPGPVLHELLTSEDARAKSFRKHIRSYNAALSFMSVGAKVVAPPGVGPPVYKVHGSVCHWTGGLLPAAGEDPVYAQLYTSDPAEALQTRLSHNPEATSEIMEVLQHELGSGNYYADSYMHMHELLQEAEFAAARDKTDVPPVTMRFSSDALRDPRRYNSPAVEEVAAVFVGADGGPPTHKDIVVYSRGQKRHRVSELHACVDPLSYILLFPRGYPDGWSPDLKHHADASPQSALRTRLTTLQFYAHRLMRRDGVDAPILPHDAGRLFNSTASMHIARRKASVCIGVGTIRRSYDRKSTRCSKTGSPRNRPRHSRRLQLPLPSLALLRRWDGPSSYRVVSLAVLAPCR